eukprot:COSAG02_NODE_2090_length_9866_cov_9.396642_7_plen_104_part_00
MLRTATGISECLPSALKFILYKLRELPMAWFYLHAPRAEDKGRCEGDDACVATAGFGRVADRFVAASTGQLAAIEDKIHIFSAYIPLLSSANPRFPAQQLAAP